MELGGAPQKQPWKSRLSVEGCAEAGGLLALRARGPARREKPWAASSSSARYTEFHASDALPPCSQLRNYAISYNTIYLTTGTLPPPCSELCNYAMSIFFFLLCFFTEQHSVSDSRHAAAKTHSREPSNRTPPARRPGSEKARPHKHVITSFCLKSHLGSVDE
jgi:hypothetical protein